MGGWASWLLQKAGTCFCKCKYLLCYMRYNTFCFAGNVSQRILYDFLGSVVLTSSV